MAAITRLSAFGFGTRRVGSFDRPSIAVVAVEIATVAALDRLVTLVALAEAVVSGASGADGVVSNATVTEWPL